MTDERTVGAEKTELEGGVLYLVATPIGNLEDITLRALSVLRQCDILLCEDTRRTKALLNRYEIHGPKLESYYREVEKQKIERVLRALTEGRIVALVSDAGLPALQDPGNRLVRAVWGAGFRVTAIPGPSSITTALVVSGLPTVPFFFWGFIPRTKKDRMTLIHRWASIPGTHLAFETGRRLKGFLEVLAQVLGECEICLTKELTKKHETRIADRAVDLARQVLSWPRERFLGEWVVLVHIEKAFEDEIKPFIDKKALQAVYESLTAGGLRPRAALRLVQQITGIPANRLYRWLQEQKKASD